jgi:TolB protein
MSCSDRRTLHLPRSRLIAIVVLLSLDVLAVGAEPTRITTDGTLKLTPVFINNGDEVAFATHEKPNLVSIVRLKLSDGSRLRQHPTVVNHQFDPAYARDGRLHAYARSATAPQMVLVIQDTQEKKDWIFRPVESRATARNPSIAPDGSRVVFTLSDIGGHQIASVNAKGEDLKYLTRAAGINAWPAFSPDGRKVAFASSRSGDFEIYVMNPDGTDLKRLTNSPALDVRPAWSPDGKRLSFTSNRDTNYEIYVMNADGSNPRNITSYPARDDHSAWHPDGKRLLFVSDRDGGSDLYLTSAL